MAAGIDKVLALASTSKYVHTVSNGSLVQIDTASMSISTKDFDSSVVKTYSLSTDGIRDGITGKGFVVYAQAADNGVRIDIYSLVPNKTKLYELHQFYVQ